MATRISIKYDTDAFAKSMVPGVQSWVFQQIEAKLVEKMQLAVNEICDELAKELPEFLEVQLQQMFSPDYGQDEIHVIINLADKRTHD